MHEDRTTSEIIYNIFFICRSVRDFIRNFNVHMIHNVETGINGINVNEKGENIEPSKLCEDNILSDGAGFIGDFVEFSPVLVEETVLEEILAATEAPKVEAKA